ncbi:hypothetical protein [Halorarius halobius]|uniref:hypothetical protein n=1 Tax=Halorarius halobius TaxID=2962671 RepID=UPI0020CEA65A|nr:hypothetical protein [Halorarius halobius]
MDHIATPFAYIAAYIVTIVVSPYLHEGSHWAVGKFGGTDPTVDWKITRFVWPEAVRHGEIATIDAQLIRLSGFSIFLWLPPWILSLGYLAADITPWTVLVSLTPFLVVFAIATESDALAVRDPEEYRARAVDGDLPGDPLFNPVIVTIVFVVSVSYPILPL